MEEPPGGRRWKDVGVEDEVGLGEDHNILHQPWMALSSYHTNKLVLEGGGGWVGNKLGCG